MTNKDFFRLMIKLFGLYQFLLLIFTSLPSNLQLLFNDFFSISSIITLILITLFILAVYYVFVKKPDLIIDFFKLDKGFDNNEIAATSGLTLFSLPPNRSCPDGKVAYISNMYTLPNYRGKRIASHIFSLIMSEAKSLGYTKVILHATDLGKPIYSKFGFIDSKDEMIYYFKN